MFCQIRNRALIEPGRGLHGQPLAAPWWRSLVGSALAAGACRWRVRRSARSFTGAVVVVGFSNCGTRLPSPPPGRGGSGRRSHCAGAAPPAASSGRCRYRSAGRAGAARATAARAGRCGGLPGERPGERPGAGTRLLGASAERTAVCRSRLWVAGRVRHPSDLAGLLRPNRPLHVPGHQEPRPVSSQSTGTPRQSSRRRRRAGSFAALRPCG